MLQPLAEVFEVQELHPERASVLVCVEVDALLQLYLAGD